MTNATYTLRLTEAQLTYLRGLVEMALDGSDRCADAVYDMAETINPLDLETTTEAEQDAWNDRVWETIAEVEMALDAVEPDEQA